MNVKGEDFMKRFRLMAMALIAALVMSLPAFALDESNADRLYDLGLFKGTGSGYALEGTATRMQGLIMLTRLLGEKEEAEMVLMDLMEQWEAAQE